LPPILQPRGAELPHAIKQTKVCAWQLLVRPQCRLALMQESNCKILMCFCGC